MEDIEKSYFFIYLKCWAEQVEALNDWFLNAVNVSQILMDALKLCKTQEEFILSSPYYKKTSNLIKRNLHKKEMILSSCLSKLVFLTIKKTLQSTPNIQCPSENELKMMGGLCAGLGEDQGVRLKKLKHYVSLSLKDNQTDACEPSHLVDSLRWRVLYQCIRRGNQELALMAFFAIPSEDLVLKALLSIHSIDYIRNLIGFCASLKEDQVEYFSVDVACNQFTFELLMHDLFSSLEHRTRINISFGLPTHHAYPDRAAGFCLISKLAVIMAYERLQTHYPFIVLALGVDVNRDDGLCDILLKQGDSIPTAHIDIHDSRVYPWHSKTDIDQMLETEGLSSSAGCVEWTRGNHCYQQIDLASVKRKKDEFHPALAMALDNFEFTLQKAVETSHNVLILLPIGWDSHAKEEAPCG